MNKLYLGNKIAAKDTSFIKSKNIKAVLNCSKKEIYLIIFVILI